LVVFPKDVDDIKKVVNKVVNYVTGKKTAGDDSISLTPHSCGTDMAGGDLNKSIILDVNAHMNKIIDIGSESAIVQPGVPFRLFEKESPKYKSMLPSYPAPKSMASVGGTVANNSGGEKSLRYGQTKTTSKLLKSSLETEMNKNLKNSIEKSWMKN
jgi:glycolate oxidase